MSLITSAPRTASRAEPYKADDALDSAPADFNPAAHPIVARHWFGIEPLRPIAHVADLRRQRQIEHLHLLGPRAVGELLHEVAEDDDLDRALAAYERLTPDLLKALGGDKFPPLPIHEVRS